MQFHLKFGVENLILEFLEAFQLKLMSFSSDHFNSVSRVFQMQVVFLYLFQFLTVLVYIFFVVVVFAVVPKEKGEAASQSLSSLSLSSKVPLSVV